MPTPLREAAVRWSEDWDSLLIILSRRARLRMCNCVWMCVSVCAYVCEWKSVLKRLNGRGLAVTPNKQDLSIEVHYKTPPIQMDLNKQKTMLKRQNGRGLAVTYNKQVLSIKVNWKLHLFRLMLLIIKKPLLTFLKTMKYYFIFSYLCIIFVNDFLIFFFFLFNSLND